MKQHEQTSTRLPVVSVTVTPFLYDLVQGTLQYTHVNCILLYARTSLIIERPAKV